MSLRKEFFSATILLWWLGLDPLGSTCDHGVFFPKEWVFYRRTLKAMEVPSRGLTYPTLGKGKSCSKCHFLEGIPIFSRKYMSSKRSIDQPTMLIYQGVFPCLSFVVIGCRCWSHYTQAWLWFWSLGGRMEVAVWFSGVVSGFFLGNLRFLVRMININEQWPKPGSLL